MKLKSITLKSFAVAGLVLSTIAGGSNTADAGSRGDVRLINKMIHSFSHHSGKHRYFGWSHKPYGGYHSYGYRKHRYADYGYKWSHHRKFKRYNAYRHAPYGYRGYAHGYGKYGHYDHSYGYDSGAHYDVKNLFNDVHYGNGRVDLQIHFPSGSARITAKATHVLDSIGEALTSGNLKHRTFVIAGHTDATGTDHANLKLSKLRAESVKRYLVEEFSIDANRLIAIGYGDSRPVYRHDPHASANRRVEVSLVHVGDEHKAREVEERQAYLLHDKDY